MPALQRDFGSLDLNHRECASSEVAFTPRDRLTQLDSSLGPENCRRHSQTRKRAQILAVARQMLAERGSSNLKMRSLAQRCGVTPPTIYHLVGARQDVLQQAIEEGLSAKFRYSLKIVEEWAICPLLAYGIATADAIANDPDYYRHAVRLISDPLESPKLISLVEFGLQTQFVRWLDEMQREGALRPDALSNQHLAKFISRAINATVIDWSTSRLAMEKLRSELLMSIGSILLGALRDNAREQIFGELAVLAV